MQDNFSLRWNVKKLAQGLQIPEADVKEYLTDGRRASFILERRLKAEHPGWTLAGDERSGYDLVDPDGKFWEVRSLTENGIYFCPSTQVGSGSKGFKREGFLDKCERLAGFIVTDITTFPDVQVYRISTGQVLVWWCRGWLGPTTRVSRSRFFEKLFTHKEKNA